MGDRAETFRESGFLETAVQRGFDTLAVDAHFGYYVERNLIPRLRADIVEPARARGYRNIWLLGVSMGGFGSILYADTHPLDVDGLVLLAPYLGDRELADAISASGGLDVWPESSTGFDESQIRVWKWLKAAATGQNGTRIVLGYGRSDRLAATYAPLIDVLDSTDVYTLDGGHRWTTWRPLWTRIAADLEM